MNLYKVTVLTIKRRKKVVDGMGIKGNSEKEVILKLRKIYPVKRYVIYLEKID